MRRRVLRVVWEMLYLLILPLDLLIPKKKGLWVFALKARVPWGDNLRSLFEYCLYSGAVQPVVLFCDKKARSRVAQLYKGTRAAFVDRTSLSGFWLYFRADVCFSSYTSAELYTVFFTTFCHYFVNLWHGIPLKTIGWSTSKNGKGLKRYINPHYVCDACISSSDIDRMAMAVSITRQLDKVWVTGLPRNDLLFVEKLADDLRKESDKIAEIKKGRKLLLYAPTFREWKSVNPLFENGAIDALSKLLDSHGYILAVRKHIWDTTIPSSSSYVDLGSHIISNPQIVLRHTDVLVTDYSSIYLDFLLRNKPVIGFCYDYDKYAKDRSFLYAFETVFPGPLTKNVEGFLAELFHLIKEGDAWEKKRIQTAAIFFKYKDGKSSQRVYERILYERGV